MISLLFVSVSFFLCAAQNIYPDYSPEYYSYDYDQNDVMGRGPIIPQQEVPIMDEKVDETNVRRVEHLLQARLSVDKVRYLLLDRKCDTLKDAQLSPRYVFTRSFVHQRKLETENCWVELKRNGDVPNYLWNVKGETKVLLHGYSPLVWEDADEIISGMDIFKLGEEYGKEKANHNVLAVDWTCLSAMVSYPVSAYATRHAGEDVANYLHRLYRRNSFIPAGSFFWKTLHLVGFSLGGHVSGVAGYQLQLMYSRKPGRITGLDPAGPEFDGRGGQWPDDRTTFLERSDADFVDIIHCNMGRPSTWATALFTGYFGSWVQAGHADFYPNGGERQSYHCPFYKDLIGCSHNMCVTFLINSIRRKKYLACKCSSWKQYKSGKCSCQNNGVDGTLMGEHCETTAYGRYYLKAT